MILDNYRLRITKKFLKEKYGKYEIVGRFRKIYWSNTKELTIFFDTIKKPNLNKYHLRKRVDIISIYNGTSYNNKHGYTFETGIRFKIIK